MNTQPSGSDFHLRLEALEARFLEILKRLTSLGPTPEHHEATIAEIEGKKAALREKLAKEGGDEGDAAEAKHKGVIEFELENLTESLERWAKHVDEEFQRNR